MDEEKKNNENNDVITEALNQEEQEFTKTLTEELKPVTTPVEEKPEEVKKVKEIEESVDAADFVTKEEFYGKENKTAKIIIIVVIVVLCILIGYFALKYMNIKIGSSKQTIVEQSVSTMVPATDSTSTTITESHAVSEYNNSYGALYFYSENNTISVSNKLLTDVGSKKYLGMYNCESTSCSLYNKNNVSFNSFADNTVLISDNGKGIIYNYNNNTILTNAYTTWFKMQVASRTYLLAVDTTSNIYGPNGNNITKSEYSDLGTIINGSLYEQLDSYITAKKDGKWGIINVTNDNVIIDFKYDAIHIETKDIFTIQDTNLWYAINANGEKMSTTGYTEIVKADTKYMMVIKDNMFDIVDYTSASLIKQDIDAPKTYKRYDDNGNMLGITLKDEGNNITLITIVQASGTSLYRFNTNTLSIAKYTE